MRLLFVHPIFSVWGGGEVVLHDLFVTSKKKYDSLMFTLFKTDKLYGLEGVVGQFIKSPPLHEFLGYKINPFIMPYVRKLGKMLARRYKPGDRIILSLFPSSLVLLEAIKHNRNIRKEDIFWICFEPDRILYYDDHVKGGYMPHDLIQKKYQIASSFCGTWRKRDLAVTRKVSRLMTLSDYVTGLSRNIYGFDNVHTDICMYVDTKTLIPMPKEKAREILNKRYGLDLRKDDFIILSLSRLENSKGLDVLVNVLDRLRKKAKFRCLIGGTGSLYDKLSGLAKKHDDLDLLGFVPDDLLSAFYSAGDAFVFLGKRETGGPLTVLEAMHCRCIPVAIDDAGPVELIEHGKTGYLVKDAKETIKALQEIKASDRKAMVNTGVLSVKKEHTLQVCHKKFLKAIDAQ